jgi:hypothetical protein
VFIWYIFPRFWYVLPRDIWQPWSEVGHIEPKNPSRNNEQKMASMQSGNPHSLKRKMHNNFQNANFREGKEKKAAIGTDDLKIAEKVNMFFAVFYVISECLIARGHLHKK